MPTNTEINQALLQQILELYNNAEIKMLEIIKNSVAPEGYEHWASEQAKNIQEVRRAIEAVMQDTSKIANSQISNAILDAYNKAQMYVSKDFGIPNTILKTIDEVPFQVQLLVLEANMLLQNAIIPILRDTNDVYRQVISNASLSVQLGTDTPQQAIQQSLNKLAAKGITGFVDAAGRHWELSGYIEMAVRTATSHAALQGHIDRQVELGYDLVKVSSHNASCPICAPWAGKILSITGKTKGYPTIEEAKLAGLFHPNCKHTVYAYYPEIYKDNELTLEQQTYKNNNELYQATQIQRYNERQIRKWKRIEAVAITPDAKIKAQAKIKYWQGRQRELVKQYNLKRQYWREKLKQVSN
jgi:hypothetical protein